MKKIVIAIMLFVTVTGAAFANDHNFANDHSFAIDHKDLPEFKGAKHFVENFPGATEVDCKITGQFTKVDFTWKELKLEVFYDTEGNLLATCRRISFNNLPLALQINVRKEYPGFVPDEVSEFNDATDGLCYYVTVTDPQKTFLLHVSVSGAISVFKKMKN